jgi:hypothetical protein
MTGYEDYSDMGLEEEYVRISKCANCGEERRNIEIELTWRGYTAREVRNVRELARN